MTEWDNIVYIFIYGLLSMSAIISNCSRCLIKYSESELTNNLIDDPDRDVIYHFLREYFFIREMLLINHDGCHMLKFL